MLRPRYRAGSIEQTVRSDCKIPKRLPVSEASMFDVESHRAQNREIKDSNKSLGEENGSMQLEEGLSPVQVNIKSRSRYID